MNISRLVQLRLCNQKLVNSEFEKPFEVVRWLGAVQAQDYNGAKWALALRMRQGASGATHKAIEKASNEGQILRTHLLRPTWHFVTPEDIRWLLALTAPRVNVRCGPNYRKYELDGPTLKRTNKILTKALQGGRHRTRAELKAELNRAGINAGDTVRMAHILLRAELDGVICSGPRIGKQFTYALLEERVPRTKVLARDEALAQLTRTYFRSHGPATLQDFVWWSGLTVGDARRGIALSAGDLEEVGLEGRMYWINRSSGDDPSFDSRGVHLLLPSYDEYNVAYKDRDTSANVPLLSPTVLLDGEIIGNWKTTADKNSVTIEITAARLLKKTDKLALQNAAARYAAYLGVTIYLNFAHKSVREE